MKFAEEYKHKGLIREEKIGFDQAVNHIERAKKDLKVAEANLRIDAGAAYNYAYLAMLRAGRGLMFFHGFRPIDGEQHKTVVCFCDYVLGAQISEITRHFDRMRKKRNRFTYDEPELLVSETETKNAIERASDFVEKVVKFIQDKNSQQVLSSP